MKCRRSKSSRGARLRGPAHGPTVQERPAPAKPAGRGGTRTDATVALLRVDGPAKGAIDYAGTVIVGRHGAVSGNITATIIVVEGQVEGNLQGAKAVRVTASARIVGDLCAPRIAVARGASVKGRVTTQRRSGPAQGDEELDDSAVADLLAGA